MEIVASIVADEFIGHGTREKSKPRPFKTERVGHPEKPNRPLSVDLLGWYHPSVSVRQLKNQRVGLPRVGNRR